MISLVTSWLMQNKYKVLELQKQPFTDGTKHSRIDQVKFVEVNVPFPYPLKKSENQKFSVIVRGYRNGAFA